MAVNCCEFPCWKHHVKILGILAVLAVFLTAQLASAGELHKAARDGDLAALSTLIANGADLNETDGSGSTALAEAANRGHVEAVAALIEAGADPLISGKGPFGSLGTPLHLAAKRGHLDVIAALLDAGVDPNLPDAGVGPPLHLAVYYRKGEAADLLRSRGAKEIMAPPIGPLLAAADLSTGKKIAGACNVCQAMAKVPEDAPAIGPPLWDIVGRPVASVGGFKYSATLMKKDGSWGYEELNNFLANPRGYLPGTRMQAFDGIKEPERRAALLLYLRSLSDTPAPLP